MVPMLFEFTACLYHYHSDKVSWVFVTLPDDTADGIRFFSQNDGQKRRGFGSVKVSVRIGETSWNTSVFPDKNSGSYLLPIKASVRKAENVSAGDEVAFNLSLVDVP